MNFRQATIDDIPAVMAIVAEVAQEMAAVGNHQWDVSYPTAERFERDVDNGALYVVDDDGVLGFVTVDHDEPDGYRGLPWTSGDFLVIHRLAVSSRSRGSGVASFIEASVEEMARSRGARLLKIDTYSTNAGMLSFLFKKGFRKVGEMEFRGKPLPFYCYEKIL